MVTAARFEQYPCRRDGEPGRPGREKATSCHNTRYERDDIRRVNDAISALQELNTSDESVTNASGPSRIRIGLGSRVARPRLLWKRTMSPISSSIVFLTRL